MSYFLYNSISLVKCKLLNQVIHVLLIDYWIKCVQQLWDIVKNVLCQLKECNAALAMMCKKDLFVVHVGRRRVSVQFHTRIKKSVHTKVYLLVFYLPPPPPVFSFFYFFPLCLLLQVFLHSSVPTFLLRVENQKLYLVAASSSCFFSLLFLSSVFASTSFPPFLCPYILATSIKGSSSEKGEMGDFIIALLQ